MNRLTEWIDEEKTEVSIVHYKMRDAMIRLAKYEDTGLEPEEIMDGKLLTGWIPVEERLPDDDNDVIVNKSDGIIDIAFWNGNVWRSLDSNYTLNVLAWMPLPEPYNPQN